MFCSRSRPVKSLPLHKLENSLPKQKFCLSRDRCYEWETFVWELDTTLQRQLDFAKLF